ncbi:general secretion pathway protein H [Polaromonas sp. CG_9.11]|nr:general secretion pathway protein H [Polaromonas sp. CG_9.11]
MRILAAGIEVVPALVTACAAPTPEEAAAPAAWHNQFHSPGWFGTSTRTFPALLDSLHSKVAMTRGAPARRIRQAGFTLIELLMVLAIMAIATAGVGLALRDTSGTALEREAQRLAVLLDSARAQSRMTANPVRWRPTATGFVFEGLAKGSSFPSEWLGPDVRAAVTNVVVLGPEPVIGPQQIRLVSISDPSRSLILATDGIRPFSVMVEGSR